MAPFKIFAQGVSSARKILRGVKVAETPAASSSVCKALKLADEPDRQTCN